MKKKKTAKIYGLMVILLPMDIIMKKDSDEGGRPFKHVEERQGKYTAIAFTPTPMGSDNVTPCENR